MAFFLSLSFFHNTDKILKLSDSLGPTVFYSVWNSAKNGSGYNLVESVQHFSEVCCRLNNSGLPGEVEKREIVGEEWRGEKKKRDLKLVSR